MKKKRILVTVLILTLLLALSPTVFAAEHIDFGDAESFEQALNNGEDVTGKIVSFKIVDVKPDSIVGFNLWAGEHLNFFAGKPINVKAGDVLTVKVADFYTNMGSWFIAYEVVSDAQEDAQTVHYDYSRDIILPLEIKEFGYTTSDFNGKNVTISMGLVLYNPNADKAFNLGFKKYTVTARDQNGSPIGSQYSYVDYRIEPLSELCIGENVGFFDVVPATVEIQFEEITKEDTTFKLQDPELTAALQNLSVRNDSVRDKKIIGELVNQSNYDFDAVYIDILYRNREGSLLSGSEEYVSDVKSGDVDVFEASVPSALQGTDFVYEIHLRTRGETKSANPGATTGASASASASAASASASASASSASASTSSASASASSGSSTDDTSKYTGYEDIYNEYAQKIRDATPILAQEYANEAASNSGGIEGLAEISAAKIEKLAEISTEGAEKMAEYALTHGSGSYSEYQDWATKLYNVYMQESQQITNAYMSSAMGGFDIGSFDMGDFDLGDFDLGGFGF